MRFAVKELSIETVISITIEVPPKRDIKVMTVFYSVGHCWNV